METLNKNAGPWALFTYGSWVVAACMMAGGIFFMEASFAAKGFYAMSALMLVHTTVSISKSLRDGIEHENLFHKIENARTEKLLKEIEQSETL